MIQAGRNGRLAMMISMPTLDVPPWFPIVPQIAYGVIVLAFLALEAWVSESANTVIPIRLAHTG